MALAVPDWLSKRDGKLTLSSDGHTWFLALGTEPQYRLVAVPAGGKFGCQVTQTINGRRLDPTSTFVSPEEALRGGMEHVRAKLGW